jgi:AcrR family transcriptional regulator
VGHRDSKREATRQALKDAAYLLAGERDFAEVTIDDITRAAGVSRRTFFNYFESKEDAFSSARLDWSAALVEAVHARPDDEDPWAALRNGLLAALPGGARRETVERMRMLWRQPALAEQSIAAHSSTEDALVREVQRRRPEAPAGQARLLAAVFLATTRTAARSWAEDDGQPAELAESLVRAIDAVTVEL